MEENYRLRRQRVHAARGGTGAMYFSVTLNDRGDASFGYLFAINNNQSIIPRDVRMSRACRIAEIVFDLALSAFRS